VVRLDLTEVIERGATRLDAAPGWVEAIDIARLDVRSAKDCVLGQIFGDYATGKERLGIKDASPYGFIHPRRDVPCGYDDAPILAELNLQWVEHIERHRDTRRLFAEAKGLLGKVALRA